MCSKDRGKYTITMNGLEKKIEKHLIGSLLSGYHGDDFCKIRDDLANFE